MKSLALFGLTIFLFLLGGWLIRVEWYQVGTASMFLGFACLFVALIVNHREHTRR